MLLRQLLVYRILNLTFIFTCSLSMDGKLSTKISDRRDASVKCEASSNPSLFPNLRPLRQDDSGDDFAPSSGSAPPGQSAGAQSSEVQSTLRTLGSKVEDLSTCNDLISKHGSALQRSV